VRRQHGPARRRGWRCPSRLNSTHAAAVSALPSASPSCRRPIDHVLSPYALPSKGAVHSVRRFWRPSPELSIPRILTEPVTTQKVAPSLHTFLDDLAEVPRAVISDDYERPARAGPAGSIVVATERRPPDVDARGGVHAPGGRGPGASRHLRGLRREPAMVCS
jgi:hypothetical protein